MPVIPSFKETYGKTGAMITAVDLLRGIANSIGFDNIIVPGATGFIDTNFSGTVEFCDAHCQKSLLKGYMMAPWTRTFAIHEQKSNEAIDQMAAAIKARG